MSALDDGPPHVIRTPSEHFAEADRLLHEVAQSRDFHLAFVKHKIAVTQVHATLAQCGLPRYDDEYDEQTALDCMLARGAQTVQTTNDRL